jgi:hypothetical protein
MKLRHSDYTLWAKTQPVAKYNLATSAVAAYPLRELPVSIEQLEINQSGASSNDLGGYAPLLEAIAKKCAVNPDCVVTTTGTSMANHLAMAMLVEAGDEVLLEEPTYELLTSTLLYLGATVKRFPRSEESGYALDPAAVRRVITPKTRLIVLANLHNPTSVLARDSALLEIGDLARSVRAHVLVDEVYLDAVYANTPRPSFHLGPEFVVTTSLTKVYGLGGLRCGWILAEPNLARDLWRLNDLFSSNLPHPAERLSVIALQNLDHVRKRSRAILEKDHVALNDFLAHQKMLSAAQSEFGTCAALCLADGNVDEFVTRLLAEQDTLAVPGRFFEMPNHFRIGMGVDSEMFREGLRRIGQTLETMAAAN